MTTPATPALRTDTYDHTRIDVVALIHSMPVPRREDHPTEGAYAAARARDIRARAALWQIVVDVWSPTENTDATMAHIGRMYQECTRLEERAATIA